MLTPSEFAPFPDCPRDIDVLTLSYTDQVKDHWASILSDVELERRAVLTHAGRRDGFTLGRVALRTLLADKIGVPAREVPLRIEPSGQLTCPGSGLNVSLAHSGDKAIAVISPRAIGVDLEEIRTKPPSLLDYILADEEKDHIYSLNVPDSHRLFLCWTLKEAVLKGMGVGLRSAPRRVVLDVDVAGGKARVTDPEGRSWNARFAISGSWIAALAF